MKICLVAEGSYPYITGGVSSWIHSLITSLPEHEFIIFAIGAQQKLKGRYKYVLPPNVSQIEEIFLDSYLLQEPSWGKRYKLTDEERSGVKQLLSGDVTNWQSIFFTVLRKED